MRTMLIYMAGPIDDVTYDEALDWRTMIASEAPAGVLMFNPLTAWEGSSLATAAGIDLGNRAIIDVCNGVLANLSGPGRGFGTIREIEYARSRGTPVAVAGELGDSLLAHDLLVQPTVGEAFDALLEAVRENMDTATAVTPWGLMRVRRPESMDPSQWDHEEHDDDDPDR